MSKENEPDNKDPKAPATKPGEGKGKDGKDGEGLEKNKISENFLKLFDGMELSEDFKEKAGLLFTAAVNEEAEKKSAKAKEDAKKEYDDKLSEEKERLSESVDRYLTHAVRTYLEENAVAIENGIRIEAANKVMESTKAIMESAGLEVPEAERSALEEAQAELAESKTKLDESIKREISLQENVNTLTKEKVFGEITEGLVMTDKERLVTLSESVEFQTADQYRAQLETLRESFIKGKTVAPATNNLDEGKPVTVDPKTLNEGAEPSAPAAKPRRRQF